MTRIPEDAPIQVSDYEQGPWFIRVIEKDELGMLVGPPEGFGTKQDAVDWLRDSGLADSDPDNPWLGLKFEILPVRSQTEFLHYCSW